MGSHAGLVAELEHVKEDLQRIRCSGAYAAEVLSLVAELHLKAMETEGG